MGHKVVECCSYTLETGSKYETRWTSWVQFFCWAGTHSKFWTVESDVQFEPLRPAGPYQTVRSVDTDFLSLNSLWWVALIIDESATIALHPSGYPNDVWMDGLIWSEKQHQYRHFRLGQLTNFLISTLADITNPLPFRTNCTTSTPYYCLHQDMHLPTGSAVLLIDYRQMSFR
jgi:hypothetical protein